MNENKAANKEETNIIKSSSHRFSKMHWPVTQFPPPTPPPPKASKGGWKRVRGGEGGKEGQSSNLWGNVWKLLPVSSVDSFRQCQSDGDIYLAGGSSAGGRGWGGGGGGSGGRGLSRCHFTRGSFEASKQPIAASNESFVSVKAQPSSL